MVDHHYVVRHLIDLSAVTTLDAEEIDVRHPVRQVPENLAALVLVQVDQGDLLSGDASDARGEGVIDLGPEGGGEGVSGSEGSSHQQVMSGHPYAVLHLGAFVVSDEDNLGPVGLSSAGLHREVCVRDENVRLGRQIAIGENPHILELPDGVWHQDVCRHVVPTVGKAFQ